MKLNLFVSYAKEDGELYRRLMSHLVGLERDGAVKIWANEKIPDSADWGPTEEKIATADLILLLVSPDYLASDYCFNVELARALERRDTSHALILPIILRPTDWKNTPFGNLQSIPRERGALTAWKRLDDAFLHAAREIRQVLGTLGVAPYGQTRVHLENATSIFVSYSHKDTELFSEFKEHMIPLERSRHIDLLSRDLIGPGDDIELRTANFLSYADVIVLLLSPAYFSSLRASEELVTALARASTGDARIAPVVLRPTDFPERLLDFTLLPRRGAPVVTWKSRDDAWLDVIRGIDNIIRNLRSFSGLGGDAAISTIEKYRIEDIFRTTNTPELNYEPPSEFELLKVELRTPGKGLVVEGPSGIGKTSTIKKAIADEIEGKKDVKWIRGLVDKDVRLLSEFLNSDFTDYLIVDDFHHVPDNVKDKVATKIKVLSEEEEPRAKLCIIGINQVGRSLMEEFSEVAGRVESISMEQQPDSKIQSMIERGEKKANVRFRRRADIVEMADGSFFLAQKLCYRMALKAHVTETEAETKVIEFGPSSVARIVVGNFDAKYRTALNKFATLDFACPVKGAGLVLLWLLRKDGLGYVVIGEARTMYPELEEAFCYLVETALPSCFENDEKMAKLMFYDARSGALSVEDPILIFYLRQTDWGEFARRAGHRVTVSNEEMSFQHLKPKSAFLRGLFWQSLSGAWGSMPSMMRRRPSLAPPESPSPSLQSSSGPWWKVALKGGLWAAALTIVYGLLPSSLNLFRVAIVVGIIVTYVIYKANPRKRYMQAFWTVLSLLSATNIIPALKLEAFVDNYISGESALASAFLRLFVEGPDTGFNIVLGLLAFTLLILDFVERRR